MNNNEKVGKTTNIYKQETYDFLSKNEIGFLFTLLFIWTCIITLPKVVYYKLCLRLFWEEVYTVSKTAVSYECFPLEVCYWKYRIRSYNRFKNTILLLSCYIFILNVIIKQPCFVQELERKERRNASWITFFNGNICTVVLIWQRPWIFWYQYFY